MVWIHWICFFFLFLMFCLEIQSNYGIPSISLRCQPDVNSKEPITPSEMFLRILSIHINRLLRLSLDLRGYESFAILQNEKSNVIHFVIIRLISMTIKFLMIYWKCFFEIYHMNKTLAIMRRLTFRCGSWIIHFEHEIW